METWFKEKIAELVATPEFIAAEEENAKEVMENNRVWKSYVWHGDKCFFVSTITRDFDAPAGTVRGEETMTWEYDWDKTERGKWIGQSGGVLDHQATCRCLISYGEIPDEDDERYLRFREGERK